MLPVPAHNSCGPSACVCLPTVVFKCAAITCLVFDTQRSTRSAEHISNRTSPSLSFDHYEQMQWLRASDLVPVSATSDMVLAWKVTETLDNQPLPIGWDERSSTAWLNIVAHAQWLHRRGVLVRMLPRFGGNFRDLVLVSTVMLMVDTRLAQLFHTELYSCLKTLEAALLLAVDERKRHRWLYRVMDLGIAWTEMIVRDWRPMSMRKAKLNPRTGRIEMYRLGVKFAEWTPYDKRATQRLIRQAESTRAN